MSMEEQIAKEIVQMSDDEVIQNVKKYFPESIATAVMKRMLTKYGRLDEQVYFLEILRLESLCRRAAEEIKMLDDKLQEISPDPDGTHTSVNLLSRLDGRIGGWNTMAERSEEE
jgi:hypothetical protein